MNALFSLSASSLFPSFFNLKVVPHCVGQSSKKLIVDIFAMKWVLLLKSILMWRWYEGEKGKKSNYILPRDN